MLHNLLRFSSCIKCEIDSWSDAADDDGDTPFHIAVKVGKLELIQYLGNLGADMHTPAKNGLSPLMFAERNNQTEAVKLIKSMIQASVD